MSQEKKTYNNLLGFGLVSLALAISYFSYNMVRVVDELPAVTQDIKNTAEIIQPALDGFTQLTEVMPELLAEIKALREQVTPALQESQAVRAEIPALLTRIDKLQAQVPQMLQESELIRQQLPLVLAEAAAIRELVPSIMAEVEAVRETIPPSLNKIDQLIDKADQTGKNVSESALPRMISGVIKVPFSIASQVGERIFLSKDLDEESVSLITEAARAVVDENEIGYVQSWSNDKAGARGEVTLLSVDMTDGKNCRELSFTSYKKSKLLYNEKTDVCLSESGKWNAVKK